MASHRIIFEIETSLDDQGNPILPSDGIVLLSRAADSTKTDHPQAVRILLSSAGYNVTDANAPLDDVTQSGIAAPTSQFRQWHIDSGFKLRVGLASQDQLDVTISDAQDWATPELVITNLFNHGTRARHEPLLTAPGATQIVGRSQRRCDIVIEDFLMSATHLTIKCEPDGYWVEDMKTHNGTLLNGRALTARSKLSHGDKLKIGDTLIEYTNVMEIIERVVPLSNDPSAVDLRARMTELQSNAPVRKAPATQPPQSVATPAPEPSPNENQIDEPTAFGWTQIVLIALTGIVLIGLLLLGLHFSHQPK